MCERREARLAGDPDGDRCRDDLVRTQRRGRHSGIYAGSPEVERPLPPDTVWHSSRPPLPAHRTDSRSPRIATQDDLSTRPACGNESSSRRSWIAACNSANRRRPRSSVALAIHIVVRRWTVHHYDLDGLPGDNHGRTASTWAAGGGRRGADLMVRLLGVRGAIVGCGGGCCGTGRAM